MPYFDHAATSWPKPPGVAEAMTAALEIAGAPGRGGHRGALEGSRLIAQARNAVARLLGVADDRRVVFTSGGTESLNLVLSVLLHPGDHVVTTAAEHNSVLRPLAARENRGLGAFSIVPVEPDGSFQVQSILGALTATTRAVVATHISNVTGVIQPIEELAEALAERRIPLLVDAAQSVGHLPIQADDFPGVVWAASGHKGLLGPLGTGIVVLPTVSDERWGLWKSGGTGSASESLEMPNEAPDRFEAGNPALPAIAGLGAAVTWRLSQTTSPFAGMHEWTERLWAELKTIPGVRLLGPASTDRHHGPTSVIVDGWDVHDLAAVLDASFDIRVRAGRHCAALVHESIGSANAGGTLRITPGWSTTPESLDLLIEALRAVLL